MEMDQTFKFRAYIPGTRGRGNVSDTKTKMADLAHTPRVYRGYTHEHIPDI